MYEKITTIICELMHQIPGLCGHCFVGRDPDPTDTSLVSLDLGAEIISVVGLFVLESAWMDEFNFTSEPRNPISLMGRASTTVITGLFLQRF